MDNSKQFYRLFVPSTYKSGEKLPLLLILPTPMSARDRPFLESRFVASQREAVQIGRFAEKFGFGVLWPGYRNAPEGWTYESTHAEEALEAVERDYAIDDSRISLYGICAGGFFAGRLASIYPNRFAAIVYDRAVFEKRVVWGRQPDADGSILAWFRALNPVGKVIDNPNLKIFVLNDGGKIEGHGEIQLSERFLAEARAKRDDIKSMLGPRKIGVSLWGSIFDFLSACKNEHPGRAKADLPAERGYAGPMSEVFATPFIVVEGTATKGGGEQHGMKLAVDNLRDEYQRQFYGAEFVIKKDTEVTDEDVKTHSLVLVGNAESNLLWGRLAAKNPNALTPKNPSTAPDKQVFAQVFKNPANGNNYVLLIGTNNLPSMAHVAGLDVFTSLDDYRVYKSYDGQVAQTAKIPAN